MNLGVIGYAGYTFYSEPHLRRSPQALSATVAGSVALLGLEGYGAEKLRQEHGKDDAAVVAQYFRENPGMFQGLLGVGELFCPSLLMHRLSDKRSERWYPWHHRLCHLQKLGSLGWENHRSHHRRVIHVVGWRGVSSANSSLLLAFDVRGRYLLASSRDN